ncbi:MAG: methionine biosynthesis protein MetW [Pseudomonadales bacterium]|nr:methionine biosynthesis protein MetW [Pseudomonadales bacterium]
MRFDFLTIEQWVATQSRVLDLGCGDGQLLQFLQREKRVRSLGVEIDVENISACIDNGVDVIQQDLDLGLANFADNSFDTVLLTQTLQAVHRPDFVLQEMLRVGKECIIAFPNFGHWQARAYLLTRGRMPVSKFMPYEWYDTPNIHFCTVKDFEELCEQRNIRVLNRRFKANTYVNGSESGQAAQRSPERQSLQPARQSAIVDRWPNMLATHAIYHVSN